MSLHDGSADTRRDRHSRSRTVAGSPRAVRDVSHRPRLCRALRSYKPFDPRLTLEHVTAGHLSTIVVAVSTTRPDLVVNCISIVKQRSAAKEPIPSITVNALFPQ